MAQRQALLRQYGYIEGDLTESNELSNRPMKEGITTEEKKAEEERKRMVMEAIKLDGKKKKYRKQQEGWLFSPRPARSLSFRPLSQLLSTLGPYMCASNQIVCSIRC